ncbi:MAG: cell division protein FtsB [Gammaproteobacteria bacterium]|nr:cell division protein FtsB [Gammaproteobacteria bacterium]MYJ51752.1 cell division protein FtsB [Gammaproteobacteria bacterium]
MKNLNLFLLVCFVALVYMFLNGNKNFFELRNLEQTLEAQKVENKSMKVRNDKLRHQVLDLKGSDEAVEAIARSELGLIKEGEVFYQIVEIPATEADPY